MSGINWGGTLDYVIRNVTDWLVHRRSPWMMLIRLGVALLTTCVGGGIAMSVKFPLKGGLFNLSLDTSAGSPALLTYGAGAVSIVLITVGLVQEVRRTRAEEAALARKRVLVIEQRGLRDTSDTPLAAAVPSAFPGRPDPVLIDLRQRVADGFIINPEAALERVSSLPLLLEQHRSGLARNDISTVYGGLVPVPFAFLTGILLDDESAITVLDWDRDAERWRLLDGTDDDDRFAVTGLDDVPFDAPGVILAVSVSYKVNLPAVHRTLGELPLVHLDLPHGSTSCHWSEGKQRALAATFRETAVALSNRRTRCIHLFIAAQNSVVFRFGRSYDKRNLPTVMVYQYEQSSVPPYPWAVAMPTHGVPRAHIVHPEMVS